MGKERLGALDDSISNPVRAGTHGFCAKGWNPNTAVAATLRGRYRCRKGRGVFEGKLQVRGVERSKSFV